MVMKPSGCPAGFGSQQTSHWAQFWAQGADWDARQA